MSHGLTKKDRMAYTGQHPWHIAVTGGNRAFRVGDEPMPIEALREVALPWDVVKVPLLFASERAEQRIAEQSDAWLRADRDLRSAKAFAILRDDGGDVLTAGRAVSEAFQPFTNAQFCELGERLVVEGNARWHTLGSLRGGSRVFGSIQAAGDIEVVGPEGRLIDVIEPFLLLANAHDGTRSLECCLTTIRPECENTVSFGLSQAKGKVARMRHTFQVTDLDHVAETVATILGIAREGFAEQAKVANVLAKLRMTADDYAAFALQVLTGEDEEAEAFAAFKALTKRARENMEAKAESLIACMTGSLQGNLPDTAYKAAQGVGEFIDHQRARSGAWKAKNSALGLDQALFGEGRRQKDRAVRLLVKRANG